MQLLAERYRLGQALSQSGSAVVHYGFDSTLQRPVAVKLFFPYVSCAGYAATDVLREARTAAGLNHPNIAQVYDYGEVTDGSERTPYLVMEFVDGETLADRLARTGALRWREAAEICADIAAALAAAHEQNLVHRDVNPRNIMLTPDGVKVIDFGIAIAADQNSIDTNGGLWGSPTHLAPEQLRGEPTWPAADVYALGLLLFECLTGSRAWPGGSLGEILAARHGRPAPRLPRIAGLPREVIRLYEACTTEDPQWRPSAASIAEILRRVTVPAFLNGPTRPLPTIRSGASAAAAPPTRPRRRAKIVASAAVVAAILSVLGVQLANGAATPGGQEVEAAVEGVHPGTTSPHASSPVPSSSTTAPVHEPAATTAIGVRKRAAARSTTSAPSSPATPASQPTTSPGSPSSPPASSPQPTPSQTADDNPSPTDPTDPPTSSTPEHTPPVTTSPAASDGD